VTVFQLQDRHIAAVDLEQYQSHVLHNTFYGIITNHLQ